MRSTRAATAVARLNERALGRHYIMSRTGEGLFVLRERLEGGAEQASAALPLDDFVRLVDTMGAQKERRMTRNDIAFAKQLRRTPEE